ncbi:MAG: hypothetical protein WC875_04390 [Candidatus Absconditabacterales bacterium]
MKKISVLIVLFCAFIASSFGFAQNAHSWGDYGDDPITVLDRVKEESNEDYKIQQTALNGVTDTQGAYQSDYKIANTLDRLRNNINPYLQRAVYIGLTIAVILLIYNGFLMVTNSLHKEGDMDKTKKRIKYILIGVILLTGFYFIIKLAVSIINSIFGGYGGNTGF